MMTIHVMLFAHLAEQAGARKVTLSCTGATAGAAVESFFAQYPALEPWRDRVAVAQREALIGLDTPLVDGDTIALLPPVSGG